jgi:hypothetical protein
MLKNWRNAAMFGVIALSQAKKTLHHMMQMGISSKISLIITGILQGQMI